MTGSPHRASGGPGPMLGAMQPRALIVDDEAPAREELRYLLEELGEVITDSQVQVVGEATNGEEALVLLQSLAYDLVLLDIRMPGLTGLEVARELAALPRRPQVIFTTAYPDHAVDAFDLAAADYLVKPFDAERLKRAVERALSAAPERGEAGREPAADAGGSGAAREGGGAGRAAREGGGAGRAAREAARPADAGELVRIPGQHKIGRASC